ncbi:MAG TPA: DNA-3-methyladenine glycosylase, partial [Fimbriimonadaceae bacterium]|nr:DNA-3-methyladenine glycosylase [Fimbriimonadaceae bacterium]
AGILIRAAQPLEGLGEMRELRGGLEDRQLLSGPGKLTKAFEITGADNGVALFDPASDLRIEPGERARVVATTRIGLAEGKGHELPWRFVDADRLEWISRPTPKPT